MYGQYPHIGTLHELSRAERNFSALRIFNADYVQFKATQRYSKSTCGIGGRDRTQEVWILGIAFGCLGLLAFGLRVMSKVFVGPNMSWGPDDWLMTAAVVSSCEFDWLSKEFD